MSGAGVEAPEMLELPTSSGLEANDPIPETVVDAGVVANIKVEEAVLLKSAPVTPVEHVSLPHVERARDHATFPPRYGEAEALLPALSQAVEERLVQVLVGPELVNGRLVEPEHGGEDLVRNLLPGEHLDRDALRFGFADLAADLRSPFAPEGREVVRRTSPIPG